MKKLITEEDIATLVSVTDPQYAPDGRRAAYVRTTVNHKRDAYSSAIMVYDTESGISNPWTFGDNRNTSPRWSPDGRRLAFVSDRENGIPQLYIIDAAAERRSRRPIFLGVYQIRYGRPTADPCLCPSV